MTNERKQPRAIRGAEPPFPAARVYSFTVFAQIRDAGVEGVQERKAYIAHTSPEAAITEAKRVLAVEERDGRVVTWLIGSADENAPDAAAEWARWHAITDAAAPADAAEDALQGAEPPDNAGREESAAPAAAQA